jgi:hypothetical protein
LIVPTQGFESLLIGHSAVWVSGRKPAVGVLLRVELVAAFEESVADGAYPSEIGGRVFVIKALVTPPMVRVNRGAGQAAAFTAI